MKQLKNTNFSDRLTLAAEARRAMLEKFQPKPMVTAPVLDDRETRRQAELAAVRETRVAEREAAKKARAEAEAEAAKLKLLAEEDNLNAKRAGIKERKAREKAEARTRREAQYRALHS